MTDRHISPYTSDASHRPSAKVVAGRSGSECGSVTFAPISPSYSRFADDLAVTLSSERHSLIWLHGPCGSGKTTFLKRHLDRWPLQCIWIDLRREHEVMSSGLAVVPNKPGQDGLVSPVLILDGVSPQDLTILLSDPGHLASTLVPGFDGPILLVSPFSDVDVAQQLRAYTGRKLVPVQMPQSSVQERLAILREHQPEIERRWHIEMASCALERAASGETHQGVMTPGASLQLLEAAAARTAILARRGPRALTLICNQLLDARREFVVAQARGYDLVTIEHTIADLEVAKAAYEVDWQEQHRSGFFDQLTRRAVEDELHYRLSGQGINQMEFAT